MVLAAPPHNSAASVSEDLVSSFEARSSAPLFVHFEIPALSLHRRVAFIVRPSKHREVITGINRCIFDMQANLRPSLVGQHTDRQLAAQLEVMEQTVVERFEHWQSLVDDWKEAAMKRMRHLQKQFESSEAQLARASKQLARMRALGQAVVDAAPSVPAHGTATSSRDFFIQDPATSSPARCGQSSTFSLPSACDDRSRCCFSNPTESETVAAFADAAGEGAAPSPRREPCSMLLELSKEDSVDRHRQRTEIVPTGSVRSARRAPSSAPTPSSSMGSSDLEAARPSSGRLSSLWHRALRLTTMSASRGRSKHKASAVNDSDQGSSVCRASSSPACTTSSSQYPMRARGGTL